MGVFPDIRHDFRYWHFRSLLLRGLRFFGQFNNPISVQIKVRVILPFGASLFIGLGSKNMQLFYQKFMTSFIILSRALFCSYGWRDKVQKSSAAAAASSFPKGMLPRINRRPDEIDYFLTLYYLLTYLLTFLPYRMGSVQIFNLRTISVLYTWRLKTGTRNALSICCSLMPIQI